jgi:RHS repeat-associated protein
VTNIAYNAKGQREQIVYGNGATTIYEYDPLTFRLGHLNTTRAANPDATASQLFKDAAVVQDLRYSYDPVGNITRIEDAALKTIIRGGQSVGPVGSFTYDAVYRLIEAGGREHIGQNTFGFNPPNGDYRDYPFVGHRANPNDLQALRNYTERYEYEPAGNLEALVHRANGARWTRRYDYQENSLLGAGKKTNRLTRTTVGNGLNHVEPYTHDAHGNMTSMPHLAAMVWDFKDQLQQAALGGGGIAYYVYDGAGQRVRKVIESQNGTRQKERLYLGGFEIYREYNGAAISLERESLHVLDDKQRIALVETQAIQNGNVVNGPVPLQRYQLGNHLGSSSVELDKDGMLIAYEEYHPYGTTSFQAGRSAAEVSLKRYRYAAKERDEESGLYYHGARYYAPWLARWTRADPAVWRLYREEPGTRRNIRLLLNPFTAMAGNPVTFVDLDGEQDTAYTRYLDRQFATVEGARHVHEGNRALGEAVLNWGRNIVQGMKQQWKEGTTADRVELAATGVGTAAGVVPYVGDYVSLVSSVVGFGAKPSWSNAAGVGLDVVGAVLPFVPALGTLKRVEKLADAAKDAEKLAETGSTVSKHADVATQVASKNADELAKLSKKAEDPLVDLYRAVGPDELADIQKLDAFRNPIGIEGKYFTKTGEEAASYARQAVEGFGDAPYTIVKTQIPQSMLEQAGSFAEVDVGRIGAHVLPTDVLPGLKPEILNFSPYPGRGR